MSIRIKNWGKHQHFKDRTPPWIKLYREILDDPDWHDLDGESVKVLIGLWLIASEDETHEGILPDSRKLAFRLRITNAQLSQALNKLSNWLVQDDINAISERYQDGPPETETEKRQRERQTRGTRRTQTLEPFSEDVRRVVNTLLPLWRKEDPEDHRPIRNSAADAGKAIDAILKANPSVTADHLIHAAKGYVASERNRYKAMQYYFGPQGPWDGHVRAILGREIPHAF